MLYIFRKYYLRASNSTKIVLMGLAFTLKICKASCHIPNYLQSLNPKVQNFKDLAGPPNIFQICLKKLDDLMRSQRNYLEGETEDFRKK